MAGCSVVCEKCHIICFRMLLNRKDVVKFYVVSMDFSSHLEVFEHAEHKSASRLTS